MNIPQNEMQQKALDLGLSKDEFARIVQILGRQPNYTELSMYSVMWSEHCSYKNSISELKKLPRSGKRLLVSAGEENAGLVDIGNGMAVAFKLESHNHPSAVEPYQGAATGVGGIMRDIFTMGARPVAALNSLRFGDPRQPRTQYLLKGVVRGIADYGNSFGVPTVAGEVYFDECYAENPLINVMAVGVVKHAHIATGKAIGEGNIVMIVGSSTGRDGIHGATFASENISKESEQRRPSVQVGDPFTEKLLLEASLEAIQAGFVVGIQDMGAAGITCSTSEMSARGKAGMAIDLAKVPLREKDMSDFEIMLSESQERMLMVVQPKDQEAVKRIFEKWDLHCQPIGIVTSDSHLVVRRDDRIVANIPAESLVLGGGAPVYDRESSRPAYLDQLHQVNLNSLPQPKDLNDVLLKLLGSPNICSRRWIVQQYDTMVRTNTVSFDTSDAAVIRLKGTHRALAVKTDCNPRYVYLNPYKGAQIAVAESARNVVCSGATPIAITNCLNFGNPYNPEVFWQFKESVRGISDACRAFDTPVTGGNVSFYNENPGGPIYPTPVIGMLGEIQQMRHVTTASFKNPGDVIILLGETKGHVGASEYLKLIHGLVAGDAPDIELQKESGLHTACLEMIRRGIVHSCHDLSEGGLAVALSECAAFSGYMDNPLGAHLDLELGERPDFPLFGEDQSRIVLTTAPVSVSEIERRAKSFNVPCKVIGEVTRKTFSMGTVIRLNVDDLTKVFYRSFPVSE
ncbi:MAG: phosphoribosylformylglycinamidine synthase subunit PurL [Bacteroidota bacterium]|jgi:phosphoribosylformylglycinamidine synthase